MGIRSSNFDELNSSGDVMETAPRILTISGRMNSVQEAKSMRILHEGPGGAEMSNTSSLNDRDKHQVV